MTRDDLIEIMARATVSWRWGVRHPGVSDPWIAHDQEMMTAALDAAEREGWQFVPPPDGR